MLHGIYCLHVCNGGTCDHNVFIDLKESVGDCQKAFRPWVPNSNPRQTSEARDAEKDRKKEYEQKQEVRISEWHHDVRMDYCMVHVQ